MKNAVFQRQVRFCLTDHLAQEAAEAAAAEGERLSTVITLAGALPSTGAAEPSLATGQGAPTPADQGNEAMSTEARNNAAKTRSAMPVGRPFKPGNPGRPKGSRNKLGEAFLDALHADWQEHGAEAIARVRQDRPQDYLKVVASTLPKDLHVRNERANDPRELTDEELSAIILNGQDEREPARREL